MQQMYPFSIPKVLLYMLFFSVTKFNKLHISLFLKRHRPISNRITLFLHAYWYVLFRKGTIDLSQFLEPRLATTWLQLTHFQKMLLVSVTFFLIINLLSFLDALCYFWSVVLLSLSNPSSPPKVTQQHNQWCKLSTLQNCTSSYANQNKRGFKKLNVPTRCSLARELVRYL